MMANGFVSLGNQTGEGWFLTGEMLELIHERCQQHRLHPAFRLPAEPYRRKRRHQRAARTRTPKPTSSPSTTIRVPVK